ncbi:sugar transporter [Pseudomonas psychrotolerans L19]|uniref:sugar porter family MFS transporter n=1 Tax=Pseudomonas TaxID=286 RepID=UPI00023A3496|nr:MULTISPECIES: sugar porter family MFS transporter [Pseudomonas]EHK70651.1 sugar transporter [Pseudomonas psychrotolerans L19]MBA1182142.1 sugar porter family MFS transporter [Pseudomonas psychrotolerans]MBA1212677.1 sugar porter family MFS transporter [Pseudomonas psychrotolerans]TCQ83133.1 sugar porter (SP) family MFS transporter [Pseudomonas sp. JUb52]
MSASASPALDSDQKASARRLIFITVLVATMGALAFGYDTGIIAGALPFMTLPPDQGGLGLNAYTEGLVTAALIVGAAFGSLAAGYLADRYGRRTTLRLLSILFVVGALGTAVAPSVELMVVARFVLGLAVGGGSATVPVFIAEIAGPKRRGRLVSRNELMIVSGQLLAYVLSALLAWLVHDNGIWRYMLAIAMVPGILLFAGTFLLPTSPRWLAAKGRIEEAEAVLERLRDTSEEVQREVEEMRESEEQARHRPPLRELLAQGWVVKLLLLGTGLGFVAQFTGVNAFMYYTPIILKSTGMGTSAALTATIGNGVVSVIATLLGIWAIGRAGRRTLLLSGLVIVVLAQLALGSVLLWLPQDLTQSYLALACILVFLLFMQMCIAPVYWLLMSELFPNQVRGLLTGVAVAVQWLCNATVAFSFPVALEAIGNYTFYVFAAINLGSLLFVYFCLPETRGKSLEEIERQLKKEL